MKRHLLKKSGIVLKVYDQKNIKIIGDVDTPFIKALENWASHPDAREDIMNKQREKVKQTKA